MKSGRSITGLVLLGVAACAGSSGCESGPYVVLNERFLELPSLTVSRTDCFEFNLGPSGGSSSAGGAPAGGGGLAVSESSINGTVLIDVSDGVQVVVHRTYDEAFFKSGKVDQFTATSTSGASMMLRFWGAFDPNSAPSCAPASDDGSRPSSP
jgi:hypothetical protein